MTINYRIKWVLSWQNCDMSHKYQIRRRKNSVPSECFRAKHINTQIKFPFFPSFSLVCYHYVQLSTILSSFSFQFLLSYLLIFHPFCNNNYAIFWTYFQVKHLKNSYMQRANTQVTAAQQNLDVAKSTLAEIKQKVSVSMVWKAHCVLSNNEK